MLSLCSKLAHYAGIILDTLACLLCLKLCRHNRCRPTAATPRTFRTRLDIQHIQATIHQYYQQGLTPSTHEVYHTTQQHYIAFYKAYRYTTLPIAGDILLLFVT